MKRRREMEKQSSSELRSAIEELSLLAVMKLNHHHHHHHHHHHNHDPVAADDDKQNDTDDPDHIPIKPFLSLCNFLVHLLDKIGPTMAVLRQDIHRNILKEASEGTSRKVTSSSKAFLWLTRSLDFAVNILELIEKDVEVNMEHAVEEAYEATLKPWHGWISSTAYRVPFNYIQLYVALKLVPDNKTLIDILKSEVEDREAFKDDIKTFTSLLLPLLDEIHSILETYELDRLKAT
ncbi:Glycolipid transfer protein domain-containing protein [Cynara cardunculus var. scolymus]|uniref:Glycolipid transfer protein domain-containing protein n=1 Tax=Cynara cardunculus var. scolymus TaxID=59895 RepID=A0A118JYI2_CYNCS|nr:Glycolipid transfer protein domain-containing protein [Cynara cardunculus var. scolymus]